MEGIFSLALIIKKYSKNTGLLQGISVINSIFLTGTIFRGNALPFLSLYSILAAGVAKFRWASRSSKPVSGRFAGRGGFDSHPFPPENQVI
jgi:hypothetical protein